MIHVSHLSKNFGLRAAIQNLSFDVQKGEVVGFLGPNGAGKSTTMKIITGFMPPSSGEVTVAGFDVFEDPIEVKKNIGFLPETPPVYVEMQVRDYLKYAAQLHGVPNNQIKKSVDSALEKTGLTEVQKRLIGNLSKGFRQRVGLAQAIVHNPPVMILDEPTVGLDPRQIIEIRSLIKSLAGDHTVILSSHILTEITATCQRIIVINRGKIVAEDTIEKLTRRNTYAMQAKNPSATGIEALRKIGGVISLNSAGNRLIFELDSGREDAREQIVATAVREGMGVLEFGAERASLEDVFLQLVTGEEGPDPRNALVDNLENSRKH